MVATVELDRFAARHLRVWDEMADTSWLVVDGTLVFVDISGFTALSEKLAALGRVGAEELTEVLNRVFGEMLDLAAARGGTLLKYGGDALLLLFEGPDHAVQAASATVEMRAALRKAADVPTSVGRVALRMSQGVHSGQVHLFRAEGSHAELILAGPAASTVTAMEGTAEAGEIVVSGPTRDLLPDDAATEPKGEGWLLKWRAARVDPLEATGASPSSSDDITALIPVGLRSFLAAGRPDSEHRQATVAFVKLLGIDGLLAINGPAVTADALGKAIDAITTIADEEEITFLATDVDLDACKVILVSGVPTTRVDEEGRMLRAVRRIADLDTPFGLKIGVNRGDVFSGEVGGSDRSTYTIMGDTVNLAARLMAAAPTGEVYATPAVIERSGTLYRITEVEPFHVKGKTAPVRAFSLGEETGARTIHDGSDTLFVGRQRELATLEAVVDELDRGTGGAFTILGPTGIGKTRLSQEAIRGREIPVFEIRAEPYGTANPYRPFRDPLRDLLGIDRGTNDDMAAALLRALGSAVPSMIPMAPLIGDVAHVDVEPTPESEAIDRRFRRDRTADLMVELLEVMRPGPFVVVAEDAHWADAATLDLLERLARESSQHPWLVMVTERDGVLEGTNEVRLGPLEPDDLEAMVHAATEAAPLRREVVAAIVDRSGGSPLFARELISIARQTGDVSSLPTSLDGVVGSQIDSLPPLPRRVLRYVSVLGRSFRTAVARDLLRSQGIELDKATRATLAAFLESDGSDRLQFRHAMVRDVAYEGLSYRMRRDLHLRAAELLVERFAGEEESIADILALHFAEAGDAERAWHFGRVAGAHSMEIYANVEAGAQFERALEAARRLDDVPDEERKELWVRLGDVRERSGRFEDSLDAYRRASKLVGDDPLARTEVMLKRARAKERSGAFSSALAETSQARKLVENLRTRESERLLARVLGYAALIRQAQEKPQQALSAAIAASEVGEAVGDDIACARAWKIMDWAYFMLGKPDEAVYSPKALEVYKRVGDLDEEARVAINLGAFAYFDGEWDKAIEYYELGREASTRAGSMVDAALAAANIGEVLVNQGHWEEAREPLIVARRTYAASGFGEGVAWADQLIGRLHGLEGDFPASIEALTASVAQWKDAGMEASGFEASIFLADALCRSGDPDAGLATLAEAQAAAPPDYLDHYATLFARMHGSILASAGHRDEAIDALRAGISLAEENEEAYEGALLVLTLERVAPELVASADVDRARETLRTLGVQRVPSVVL